MSDPYVRHDSQILVGVESEQGTAASVTRTFGKISGETELPDPSIDWLEERSISGEASRELSDKYPGQRTYDGGTLPVIPVDGFPVALAFGNDTVTADTNLDATGSEVSETGTTLHTIDVLNDKKPPSVTIEAAYFGRGGADDFVRTFTGGVPPGVTISVDNEGRLTTDLDMLAMGVTPGSSPTTGVDADDRNPWIFDDVNSNLSLFGNSYARVTNFEHELTTNADPRHYIAEASGRDPFEVLYANAEHELTATITVTNDSLYTELLNANDAGSASIQFTKPSGEVFRYEAGSIGLSEAPHSIPEEGANEVEVTITPNTAQILVTDTQVSTSYLAPA
jgi:hypothetical protein